MKKEISNFKGYIMKKLFITAIALAILPTLSMAQDAEDIKHGPYERTKFTDNLYIGIDGGLDWVATTHMFDDPAGERIGSPLFDIYVGKWLNPVLGVTLRLDYARPYYMERFTQFGAGVELPVNLSNWICGYREDRFYNLLAVGGAGVKLGGKKDLDNFWHKGGHKFEAYISLGIQNVFRLNKNWDINVDVAYSAHSRNSYINTPNANFRGEIELTAGVSYTFNPGFTAVERCASSTCHIPCDTKINELEQALADCQNKKGEALAALEREKNRPIPQPKTVAPTMSVFFRINSAKVLDNYKYNLKYYADAIKACNDNFTIYGFADLQTGTRAYNEKLALKRAETVRDILVNDYGVDANRLTCAAGDLDNAPFDKSVYNRAVLVQTK